MGREIEDISFLKGKTLKVYQYIVKSNEPARIREIQRNLKFSSPSLVIYHIQKLKEEGLVKEEALGYVPDKMVLKNLIRVRNSLIPRLFFYTLFFALAVIIELTLLLPTVITKEYFIAVFFTILAAIGFGVETYSQWHEIVGYNYRE